MQDTALQVHREAGGAAGGRRGCSSCTGHRAYRTGRREQCDHTKHLQGGWQWSWGVQYVCAVHGLFLRLTGAPDFFYFKRCLECTSPSFFLRGCRAVGWSAVTGPGTMPALPAATATHLLANPSRSAFRIVNHRRPLYVLLRWNHQQPFCLQDQRTSTSPSQPLPQQPADASGQCLRGAAAVVFAQLDQAVGCSSLHW